MFSSLPNRTGTEEQKNRALLRGAVFYRGIREDGPVPGTDWRTPVGRFVLPGGGNRDHDAPVRTEPRVSRCRNCKACLANADGGDTVRRYAELYQRLFDVLGTLFRKPVVVAVRADSIRMADNIECNRFVAPGCDDRIELLADGDADPRFVVSEFDTVTYRFGRGGNRRCRFGGASARPLQRAGLSTVHRA